MMTNLLRKLLVMSRYGLIVFLLQIVFYTFLLAEPSKGQKSLENIMLTVEFQGSKLKDVFTRLEKITDFQFAYQKGKIRNKRLFSISRRDISLANLLREIARETKLKFRRVNEIIHVTEDGTTNNAVLELTVQDRLVTGKVTDENGEGLPGVSVLVKGTTQGS